MSYDDRKLFDRIIPEEEMVAKYCPMIVDPIKWDDDFDTEFFEAHTDAFLGAWLRTMQANPEKAVASYLLATVGFWDVARQTYDGYICATMWPGLDFEQSDVLKDSFGIDLEDRMHAPVLVSSATFGWMMLLCASICLARRHLVRVIPLLPGILIWATILVATPLAFSLRYVFPLVLVTPLAVVTSLVPGEESLEKERRSRFSGFDDDYYYDEDDELEYDDEYVDLDELLPRIPDLPEL